MHEGPAPAAGPPLESIGQARRFELAEGRELWRVADEAIAHELLTLGSLGLGGFVEAGRDEQGLWLIRAATKQSLGEWLAERERAGAATREDVPTIVEFVLALARRLAAAESRGLYPGPLGPRSAWQSEGVWLDLDPWIRARLGAATPGQASGSASLSRDWLTPEGAAGVPEHAGSNRWRLGLILYRALAGQGPFASLGLRSAIDQLARGVPPLPDAVAAGLPPGLHALLLRMLDPDPARRPESAAAIAEALASFTSERPRAEVRPRDDWHHAAREAVSARRAEVRAEAAPIATPKPIAARRPLPFVRLLGVLAVLIAGVGLGSALLELPRTPGPDERTPREQGAVKVGTRAALDSNHTSADDCATCHPRQTSEWKRSVMGHSAKSPLFQGLEILIQEQVGHSDACPGGAGILRRGEPSTSCFNPASGLPITGSGGALWCANCHTPRENLAAVLPAWDGRSFDPSTRRPLRDLQPASTTEGIDCGFCHQVHGPVQPGNERLGLYEGNPSWINNLTGRVFAMRPEDRGGVFGIANSGYLLDPGELLVQFPGKGGNVAGDVHRRPSAEARAYLQSSQFCGACHDVRLFGSDAIGTPDRGEHFRRLRNAYSEWVDWTVLERKAGREPADCQDCHMSSFPGVCAKGDPPADPEGSVIPSALRRGCPPGTHFESRAPGERPELRVAAGSAEHASVTTHYFSGVDVPLTPEFDAGWIDQPTLDAAGIPLGAEQRRDLLLGRSFRFELGEVRLAGGGTTLEVPIEIENTGAGHKIPAGFSQEREFWVHLKITDAEGNVVYEVGRVENGQDDLHDKEFVAVNVDDRALRNNAGQPLGLFGADVSDGPDVAQWQPIPGTPNPEFRGRGLINFQNGFLRCVRCIGFIDAEGRCQPRDQSQAATRAGRFEDGEFDDDTGECRSNLSGREALFETYFPVGALDASRGVFKGPDAIIDERSAPPHVPQRWTYALGLGRGVSGPLTIEARLMFRAFPPFLIRAFANYERLQSARGLRPSGPLVGVEMLDKLEAVEILSVTRRVDLPASSGRR
ncbi:hypothetical protein ACNOYE_20180 [Nannocystaceae bacterium ST9]